MMSAQALLPDIERLEQLSGIVKSILGNSEAWLESFPLPAWIKSPTGEMVFCNQAYANIYNVDRSMYVGRRDTAVWGDDVAAEFAANDSQVARTGSPGIYRETLDGGHEIHVMKFPVYDGVRYLGVGGIVVSDGRAEGIPRLAPACDQGPSASGREA